MDSINEARRSTAQYFLEGLTEIVARLNKAIVETLALAEVRTALDKIAVTPRSTTPEQYRVLIARDAARWKTVATAANIKLE